MFGHIPFIKAKAPFNDKYTQNEPAPLFRRSFTLGGYHRATIDLCALGIGYFYLNGKAISEDLFTAPVSDYNKTLWVTRYDVTDLLKVGKNSIACILGNGFFNESFDTTWKHNKATWRDNPKCIIKLTVDGKVLVTSDEQWRFSLRSPVTYNHLRSGEYFDSRLFDERWHHTDYDDSDWQTVVIDKHPPRRHFQVVHLSAYP